MRAALQGWTKGLVWIALLSLVAIVTGILTFVEGRAEICDVVEALPGAECGPSDDPDPSAGTAVLAVFGLAAVASTITAWRVRRAWRVRVAGGEDARLSRIYWLLCFARPVALLLGITLFFALTATVERDDAASDQLRAWPLLVVGAFTASAAAVSASRRRGRARHGAVVALSSGSLPDVMAAGGGWCEFAAAVAGPVNGGPQLSAPMIGAPCAAWAVAVQREHTETTKELIKTSPYEALPDPREDVVPDPKTGEFVTQWYGKTENFSAELFQTRRTSYGFGYVEQSREPFDVSADGKIVTVLAEATTLRPKEVGRVRVREKEHPDWYAFLTQHRKERLEAAVGAFRPRDKVIVRGAVFQHDGHWYVASPALSSQYGVTAPTQLAGDLEAMVAAK